MLHHGVRAKVQLPNPPLWLTSGVALVSAVYCALETVHNIFGKVYVRTPRAKFTNTGPYFVDLAISLDAFVTRTSPRLHRVVESVSTLWMPYTVTREGGVWLTFACREPEIYELFNLLRPDAAHEAPLIAKALEVLEEWLHTHKREE